MGRGQNREIYEKWEGYKGLLQRIERFQENEKEHESLPQEKRENEREEKMQGNSRRNSIPNEEWADKSL